MMQRKNGLGKWREQEFYNELGRRGYEAILDRISRVEIPLVTAVDCEEIAQQWRWNEFGDQIRKLSYQEAGSG